MAVKRWNGTSWEIYAGSDLAPVKVTDGRVGKTTFIGATTPTGMVDGDIWIDQDTATNAVVPTALLAKGDIFVATGNGAYTRLAAGNNGDNLVVDSTTSTGLRWSGTAESNLLANGSFDFWQRGTGPFTSNTVYTADRWFIYSMTNYSLSQETSIVPEGATNAARITITGANGFANLCQVLEQSDVEKLAGKTVTFSVYLRANSTYNGSFALQINWNTTPNSQTAAPWTNLVGVSHTPSTSQYTRVSVTATVPLNAKGLQFMVGQNVVLANGSIFYIGLAKAEIGSAATPWSRAGGTIAGELAACQRYFQKIGTDGNPYQLFTVCTAESSTTAWGPIYLPVKMRISPAGSFTSTQPWNLQGQNISNANMYFDTNQTGPNIVTIGTISAVGMTAHQSRYLRANNDTTTCLNLSAEL